MSGCIGQTSELSVKLLRVRRNGIGLPIGAVTRVALRTTRHIGHDCQTCTATGPDGHPASNILPMLHLAGSGVIGASIGEEGAGSDSHASIHPGKRATSSTTFAAKCGQSPRVLTRRCAPRIQQHEALRRPVVDAQLRRLEPSAAEEQ